MPTALPERGEAHEVDLVVDTKVAEAFVECGDRVLHRHLAWAAIAASATSAVVKWTLIADRSFW